MKEIFKDVVGYEGKYKVSNMGYVISSNGKIVKPFADRKGYLRCSLHNPNTIKTIHRIVATAFIPNPDNKPEINHKDCNTANNRADNLEWMTSKENSNYRDSLGHNNRVNAIEAHSCPCAIYDLEGNLLYLFKSHKEAAVLLDFDATYIGQACKGVKATYKNFIWRDVDYCKPSEVSDYIQKMHLEDGLDKVMQNRPSKEQECVQLSMDDVELARYSSCSEAARECKLSGTSIARVCRGERNSYAGFKWKYSGNSNNVKSVKYDITKYVARLDSSYNIDKVYTTCKEAAEKNNINQSSLSSACRGEYSMCGGYRWRYVTADELLNTGLQIPNDNRASSKPCAQYDPDTNELIDVYVSCVDAGKSVGATGCNISMACNGQISKSHGYRWEYIDMDTYYKLKKQD